MNLHKSHHTSLIKELEQEYKDASSLYQKIFIHAAELFMDDVDEPAITEEEIAFLKYAYSVIKARGESVDAYSEKELFQIHSMLVSSVHLNRAELIENAGLSKDFVFIVEAELERLGYTFM